MTCAGCGFANPEAMRFCGQCGVALQPETTCAACGLENPPGFKFCGGCGASLAADSRTLKAPSQSDRRPPTADLRSHTPKHLADKILSSRTALEGERKQVTVLFADVKGSMELAEQLDPEAFSNIMQRFFRILSDGVERFEGFVAKFTGDGIMALFGASIAHEDHAQRACYAALRLQAHPE